MARLRAIAISQVIGLDKAGSKVPALRHTVMRMQTAKSFAAVSR
jgi:hypothetical protein